MLELIRTHQTAISKASLAAPVVEARKLCESAKSPEGQRNFLGRREGR